VRFWDSSAVIPLLVREASSPALRKLAKKDPQMIVWWGTPVECVSALSGLEREWPTAGGAVESALKRLEALARIWHEVQPVEQVRRMSLRLLRVHPLRAADALQLAAAIAASRNNPPDLPLVSLEKASPSRARPLETTSWLRNV
jgi:predicted nucleic acid-binding protein